jgi:hypothetical protein
MANTKLPPQRSKMRRIEGFDKNVSQLTLYVNELYLYISLLNMVSQEVVSQFNVFGSPVENFFLRNLLWKTSLWARLMALELSHMRGTLL